MKPETEKSKHQTETLISSVTGQRDWIGKQAWTVTPAETPNSLPYKCENVMYMYDKNKLPIG